MHYCEGLSSGVTSHWHVQKLVIEYKKDTGDWNLWQIFEGNLWSVVIVGCQWISGIGNIPTKCYGYKSIVESFLYFNGINRFRLFDDWHNVFLIACDYWGTGARAHSHT